MSKGETVGIDKGPSSIQRIWYQSTYTTRNEMYRLAHILDIDRKSQNIMVLPKNLRQQNDYQAISLM